MEYIYICIFTHTNIYIFTYMSEEIYFLDDFTYISHYLRSRDKGYFRVYWIHEIWETQAGNQNKDNRRHVGFTDGLNPYRTSINKGAIRGWEGELPGFGFLILLLIWLPQYFLFFKTWWLENPKIHIFKLFTPSFYWDDGCTPLFTPLHPLLF